jgi:hypothetical protein
VIVIAQVLKHLWPAFGEWVLANPELVFDIGSAIFLALRFLTKSAITVKKDNFEVNV